MYLQYYLVVASLVPHETAAVLARSVYTIQPCHVTSCKAACMFSCNPPFWQTGRDLLRATEVTRGWNGYQNKNQHRRFTLENKIILQGLKPATFHSQVWRSNQWTISTPPKCSLVSREAVTLWIMGCYSDVETGLESMMSSHASTL